MTNDELIKIAERAGELILLLHDLVGTFECKSNDEYEDAVATCKWALETAIQVELIPTKPHVLH